MPRVRDVCRITLGALVLLLPAVAGAESLSWRKLVERPEFWPHECHVVRPIAFETGATIASGQTVSVIEVHSKEILLVTTDGAASFSVQPDKTDVLEIANREWKELTPAQRDLSYPALLKRTDLWPSRVAIMAPVLLGQNEKVAPGEQVSLLGFDGSRFVVALARIDRRFQVAPHQIDILRQARGFLAGKPNASPFADGGTVGATSEKESSRRSAHKKND